MTQKLSIVIPCYNSSKTIEKVVNLSRQEIEKLHLDYEFILVNDGSSDDTFAAIEKICNEDKRVIGVELSKNFGQHNAIMAGLNQASGDLILGMDDDLQTHPSQIPKLLATMEQGYDVVYATYPEKKHSLYRNLGSKFYRWTMHVLTGRSKDVKTSSFWVAKDFVIKEVIKYTAPHPHISALIFRVTNNVGNVVVEHHDREYGQSGYTFIKLVKLWSTSINFSITPLRIVTTLGFICGFIGLIATAVVFVSKLLQPSTVLGWSSLMAVLLLATGLIIFSIGMVGEYVGRLFVGEGSFPQFVIKEELNKNDDRDDHNGDE